MRYSIFYLSFWISSLVYWTGATNTGYTFNTFGLTGLDNGIIWQSNTTKTGVALDKYKAVNGKYKRNYLLAGEFLEENEFIGSCSFTPNELITTLCINDELNIINNGRYIWMATAL